MLLKENTLLRDRSSSAIVAVRDIARAREFYAETLGLEVEDGGEDAMLVVRTGDTQLLVYESEFAGTNKANAVVWDGDRDFDAIVDQLRDGVHRAGAFKGVWFKDPDGNILHIASM